MSPRNRSISRRKSSTAAVAAVIRAANSELMGRSDIAPPCQGSGPGSTVLVAPPGPLNGYGSRLRGAASAGRADRRDGGIANETGQCLGDGLVTVTGGVLIPQCGTDGGVPQPRHQFGQGRAGR